MRWGLVVLLTTVACTSGGGGGDGDADVDTDADGDTDGDTDGGAACEPDATYDGCSCYGAATEPGSLDDCSEATVDDAVCCTDADYPSAFLSQCTCLRWECHPLLDGSCYCAHATPSDPPSEACTATPLCCVSVIGGWFTCSCGHDQCDIGDEEVADCSTASYQCDTGESRTLSCL